MRLMMPSGRTFVPKHQAGLRAAIPRHDAETDSRRHFVTANGNGTVYVLRLQEWAVD